LAKTVLEVGTYVQFRTWWQDEARQMAHRNQQNNVPITAEQIIGSGPWVGVNAQLQYDDAAIVQTR
jgi:hypothetical protein